MSLRLLPISVLAVALSASSLQDVRAQNTPAPPVQPTTPAQDPEDRPRPRRDGEGREGGPRGEGREGGRREGGGREGGPRGGGRRGEGGPDGPRPDETPEQRTQRMLAPYIEMVPDLSDAQKTHIMAILDAASAETRAIREDTALSEDRQRAATRYVRGDIPNRVASALTEEQLVPYNQIRAEREAAMADMEKVGSARPDEDVEEMRARVLKGYEDVLEELSVKQKTDIIKILEDSAEQADVINADTKRTPAEKTQALRQLHDQVSAKVLPLLDAEQSASWKKAHAAKRP